ncbi:ABC transporter ATP-binding protein [Stutzerimonas azotifigens]|uniref:ABC transporter ATP-binding protein n=1 Tax=Stutzerimonas azotifigens TaxID=291995 RepID=UPI00041BA40F|nr:ATP-binding cassette domain-containing protein [Stutzerimonas azotifigens]
MSVLLQVEALSVSANDVTLLEPLSLSLKTGEALTILGETGAGKSLLVQAIMGLLPSPLQARGRVLLDGQDIGRLKPALRARLWGRQLAMLPQEPWHALDPLMPAEQQVAEVYRYVGGLSAPDALERSRQDLAGVGLAGAAERLPGHLSGGMAQRLAFCAATAGGAPIVLADEPTKGLDASRRDQVAALLRRARERGAVLTVTHNIEVARQLGGHILVMRDGRLVEQGEAEELLARPKDGYTRALIGADPQHWPDITPTDGAAREPVLTVRGLHKSRGGRLLFEGLHMTVGRGEIIGISGDSGCGKSSLGDILLGLLPADGGEIRRAPQIARHRYLKLYQDPPAAFAPGIPLGRLFDDLIGLHRLDRRRLAPLLQRLRLDPGLLQRTSVAVSGGELQRLAIARALLLEPLLLFADEPVSRLDPITAREVIALLVQSATEQDCAVLLVSHDLELLRKTCHHVVSLGGRA